MTSALLPIRTVRRLTDGESATEVKRVGGFVIERLPIPPANLGRLKGKLTKALDALEIGQCLTLPGPRGKLNIRTKERLAPKQFTERKTPSGGRRIWRVA